MPVEEQIPIFVVSLSDSRERREAMGEALTELGLGFEFVDAVDARDGLPESFEEQIDREAIRKNLGRDMLGPELGCALSHALVYREILKRNLSRAIVLEDDIVPTTDFLELLRSSVLERSQYDLVLLYYNLATAFRWSFRPCLGNYKFFRFSVLPSSTACYYLTRAGASKLLEAATPVSFVADWPLLIPFRMRSAGIFPSVIKHSLPPSLIEQSRRQATSEIEAASTTALSRWTQIRTALRSGGWKGGLEKLYFLFLFPLLAVRVGGTDEENASGVFDEKPQPL